MTDGLDFNQFLFGPQKNNNKISNTNKLDIIVNDKYENTLNILQENIDNSLTINKNDIKFDVKNNDFNEKILKYEELNIDEEYDSTDEENIDYLKIDKLEPIKYDYKIELEDSYEIPTIHQLNNIIIFDKKLISYYNDLKKKSDKENEIFVNDANKFLSNNINFKEKLYILVNDYNKKSKKYSEIVNKYSIKLNNSNIKEDISCDNSVELDRAEGNNVKNYADNDENIFIDGVSKTNNNAKINNEKIKDLGNTENIKDKTDNDFDNIAINNNFKDLNDVDFRIDNNSEPDLEVYSNKIKDEKNFLEKIDLNNINYKQFENIDDNYIKLYYTFNNNKNNQEFLDEDLLALSKKEEEIKALQSKKQEEFDFNMEALIDDDTVKVDLTGILDD